MDSQRQEYIAVLASLEPEEAVNVLNNRVALIHQINTSIADFLEERRRIEERYAADLRKLVRRPQQDASASLGIFEMPWQRILSGTENLAQSHETLASKIQADVELPLRQYGSSSRETEAISTTQGNLASLAKDVSRAREKVDKLTAKGSKKADDANVEVEEATRAWESQSPSVFSQLQALDESRLEHLRGVLTQFQTHEADQVERNRASAESCLNALLNIEMADEIKTFAVKVQQGRSSTARRPSTAVGEPRPSSSSNVPPTPPPPRNQDSRWRANASNDKLGALPETTPHKSKMGGLKRLGTVMRRKSVVPPPPTPLTEKKKEKRSIFRRGDSSRSFQDLEETGRDLTPVPSQQEHDSLPANATAMEADSRPTTSKPSAAPNGTRSPIDELPQPLVPASAQRLQPAAPPAEQPSASATQDPFSIPASTYNAVTESEDASRNLKIRDQPIPEDADAAQLAMSSMANQLRLQAQTSGLNRSTGSVRGRRDVRNTMFISGNQDIAGLTASSPSAGLSPPSTSANVIAPSTTQNSSLLTSPDLATGVRRVAAPSTSNDDHATISDATSIHSAQSLAVLPYHPELHEPGLNASIVETVNTSFSETGVTNSFVVGEIAFSHIASPTATPQDTETIRLRNFQILEKVAANPNFVAPYRSTSTTVASAEEAAGSYTVSLSAIRRTNPTVGLKYQLHLNETDLARYSPILITPAWQIVAGQASAIVLYSLNPSFASSEVTLKNVVISVNLNLKDAPGSKPTTAAMLPTQGASFRRKAGAVVWRFSELKVTPQQERLLVRFQIENSGVAQKSGVEVKFELPNVTAGDLGVEKQSPHLASSEADPFADSTSNLPGTSGWTSVPTKRLLVSGRYAAI